MPGHCHGVARYVDVYHILVYGCQSLYQLVLSIRQFQTLAVIAFGVLAVTLVESAHEDDVVGTLGLLYGFAFQLFGRAVVAQVCIEAVARIAHDGVAHISAGIVYLYLVAQTSLESVERTYLALYLQR